MDQQTHEHFVSTVNAPNTGPADSATPPIDSKNVNGQCVPAFLNGNVTQIVPPDVTRPFGDRARWLPFGYTMVSKRRRFACPLCQMQKVSRRLANFCVKKSKLLSEPRQISNFAFLSSLSLLPFLPSFSLVRSSDQEPSRTRARMAILRAVGVAR